MPSPFSFSHLHCRSPLDCLDCSPKAQSVRQEFFIGFLLWLSAFLSVFILGVYGRDWFIWILRFVVAYIIGTALVLSWWILPVHLRGLSWLLARFTLWFCHTVLQFQVASSLSLTTDTHVWPYSFLLPGFWYLNLFSILDYFLYLNNLSRFIKHTIFSVSIFNFQSLWIMIFQLSIWIPCPVIF